MNAERLMNDPTIMPFRVPLDFIGNGNAPTAYGGYLKAWSFNNQIGLHWFREFRKIVIDSIGLRFLPIYRMADGEFRFLVGRRFNRYRKPIWKEIVAQVLSILQIRNPRYQKNSWGEAYSRKEHIILRKKYFNDLRSISESGYLALFLNDNGLHCGEPYMKPTLKCLSNNGILLKPKFYVPFHFIVQLLVGKGWEVFFHDKNFLVVTSFDEIDMNIIKQKILYFGARTVQFIRISRSKSMLDKCDLSLIYNPIDICLIAAGIGTSNILVQLKSLNTLALDVGGLMNCFVDNNLIIHGAFQLPLTRKCYS
jgi:hypothetical protein